MAARVTPRLGQPLAQWWAKASRVVTKSKYLVWATIWHACGGHSVPFGALLRATLVAGGDMLVGGWHCVA